MSCHLLLALAATALFGADEEQLALLLRAQNDFDRVELSSVPQVQAAAQCVQSQAALLAVAPRSETSLVRFRKAYCMLAGATVTGVAEDYREAAGEFEKAIAAWPGRTARSGKNAAAEPVSSGLRVLTQVSRLKAGVDSTAYLEMRQLLEDATQSPTCPANLMPANLCEPLTAIGKQWMGWIALQRGELAEAVRDFQLDTAWAQWTAGRESLRDYRYRDAVGQYQQAIESWRARVEPESFLSRLGPQPAMPEMMAELGSAQLLNREPAASITSFDAAIKGSPNLAHAIFLRGRAKELLGQTSQSLEDYSLASRTAFANAQDLASGEAHLYRGIFLYRRKEYGRAEDEFSSALNFEIPESLRPDASAWRRLAAVAGGACEGIRSELEDSLARVSPYFPKEEARRVAASCSGAGAAITGSVLR